MPRFTGYTKPLNLDPQKHFKNTQFSLFSDPMVPTREEIASIIDTLPEEPCLPGTALQCSQNTDRLTTLIELVKRTQEKICAIEESI